MFDKFTIMICECPKCRMDAPYHKWHDDPYEGRVCDECGVAVKWVRNEPAEYISVAVYEVGRSYGGPEEGGWWYDAGVLVPGTIRQFQACDFPQVREHFTNMERRYPHNPRMSGVDYAVKIFIDQSAPRGFPDVTPRYS